MTNPIKTNIRRIKASRGCFKRQVRFDELSSTGSSRGNSVNPDELRSETEWPKKREKKSPPNSISRNYRTGIIGTIPKEKLRGFDETLNHNV